MRHVRIGVVLACLAALIAGGCGGPSTQPSPPPGSGTPPPPANNTPPQVKSIALSEPRAEVGTPLTITASVEDVETPVASLIYAWKAPTGTFTGTGPVVTWVAGEDAVTPADVVLTLTVTEKYGTGATAGENTVSSTTTVHLNNSPIELSNLSMRFLGDFANSRISPEKCVSEFSDSCSGKKDELQDIDDNRHDFEIIASILRPTSVSIASSRLTATVHTACSFTSRVITTAPREESCQGGKCPLGSVGSVQGDCWTTNVYEKGRWWICESHFSSPTTLTAFGRAFFGIRGPG